MGVEIVRGNSCYFFYLDIELAFQIINITVVSFELLCFLCSNVYVTVFINEILYK